MNIETGQQPPADLILIEAASQPTPVDNTAAALEHLLQREQDGRKEERFGWILIVTILADCIMADKVGWFGGPIFLLELIGLIYAAKRLGVDPVVVFLERLFHWILEKTKFSGSE